MFGIMIMIPKNYDRRRSTTPFDNMTSRESPSQSQSGTDYYPRRSEELARVLAECRLRLQRLSARRQSMLKWRMEAQRLERVGILRTPTGQGLEERLCRGPPQILFLLSPRSPLHRRPRSSASWVNPRLRRLHQLHPPSRHPRCLRLKHLPPSHGPPPRPRQMEEGFYRRPSFLTRTPQKMTLLLWSSLSRRLYLN